MKRRNRGWIGPYEVLEQLGRGGMGVVYQAREPDSGEVVAVKTVRVPDTRALASIRREIHALERLRHPGVVRVLAQGVHKGLPWYAMELLTCRTLAEDIQATWEQSGHAIPQRTSSHDSRSSDWLSQATLTTAAGNNGAGSSGRQGAQPGDGSDQQNPVTQNPDLNLAAIHSATLSPVRHEAMDDQTRTDWSSTLDQLARRKPAFTLEPSEPPAVRSPAAAGVLEQKLRVILRLAETLVVVHGAGVVHRDLKPDNIFVRPTGEPVLVDFGLVAYGAAGREILGDANMVAGTLHYMSPEQLRGEYVDARGDLYSLGCILYEALTGLPPFPAHHNDAVVFQQLHVMPAPPSHYVDDVPSRLDDLVLALLAKSPRERIGYASDVAAELGAILDQPAELPRSVVTSCHQLYRSSFTGRDKELGQLQSHFDVLQRDAGAVVVVRGPSGVGKTRLLMEFLRRVSANEALRITGECVAVGLDEHADLRINAPPLHPFGRLLQYVADRCHNYGERETRRTLGRDLRVLGEFEPALLGVPGASDAPAIVPLPSDAARQRAIEALWRLALNLAKEKPLLLIIDDLQWADELSLAFVDWMRSQDLSQAAILLIAACRDRDLPSALNALIESDALSVMDLELLDTGSINQIIGDMLALDTPPASLMEHLDPDHAGNPFYVAEFLQMARDSGILLRNQAGRWQLSARPDERLPRSIEAVCRRRLKTLGPVTRRLVDVAAVMGRVLDLSLIERVGELSESQILDAVDELILHKLLQKDMTGALSFVHEVVCQVAYDELPAATRQGLHMACANALENAAPDRRELPLLAHHWSGAGVAGKAFEYLIKNARTALETGAHQQAMLMMERVWLLVASQPASLGLTVDQRADALLLTAEAAFGLGRLDMAEDRVMEVLALYGYPISRATPSWVFGLARGVGGQLASAIRRRAPRAPRDDRLWSPARQASVDCARALNLLQRLYVAQSDFFRILASCFMAANECERAGPPANPAVAYSIIGSVCGSVGLTGVATGYFDRAHQLARRERDPHTDVSVAVTEHLYYLGAGAWAPLEQHAETYVNLAWDIGARFEWEALVMIWQTYRLRRYGCAGVVEALEQVMASARARANPLSRAFAEVRAGECALARGNDGAAMALARAAHPVLDDSDPAMGARASALMAYCHLIGGAHDQALAAADRALAALRGPMLLHLHEDGCRLVTEVFLTLWDHARRQGSGNAADLGKKVAAACKLMSGLARRHPASRPLAMRLRGAALRVAGRHHKARTMLEAAHDRARAADIAPEQGAILLEMARCHAPGSAERRRCLDQARVLLARCGCTHLLDRLDSLMSQ